jgi:cobalt-zinc-cadmium resistance protein CzcA
MMTCLAASVGLLPAALFSGVGAQVQRPLAIVVVGGNLLAPILILIVLPVLIEACKTSRAPDLLAMLSREAAPEGASINELSQPKAT